MLTLEQIKSVELGILDAFDAWCTKHGLTWWLAYGTLIGAARHKGFIPWDDDIDLVMPYRDFMRMIELSNSGQTMPEPFCINSNKISNAVADFCSYVKIFDMRTKANQSVFRSAFIHDESVWIDVFPLVGAFADQTEQRRYSNGTYRSYMMSTLCTCGMSFNQALVTVARRILIYPYARLRGYHYWLRRYDRLLDEYPDLDDSQRCVIPPYNSGIFETADFAETVKIEFEGESYPAPAGYDAILRVDYGDYLQLPPEEQRVSGHDFTAKWR
jgi:lipopolysaccharide cholinephosphotransferase